jgi:hypothetical protein
MARAVKETMNERPTDCTPQVIRRQTGVPIFGNTVILRQLAVALGVPFGLVAPVIGITSGKSADTLYALGFIAVALILTWLFIAAVYRGKYEAEFVLDSKGAPSFCGAAGRKILLCFVRLRIMNRLKLLCVGICRFSG